MQIRCQNCHRPFAVGKEAVHYALDTMTEEGLQHYDVKCPHCRRVNRVSREALLRAAPGWSTKKDVEDS
jgi:phage FluMu protein Com